MSAGTRRQRLHQCKLGQDQGVGSRQANITWSHPASISRRCPYDSQIALTMPDRRSGLSEAFYRKYRPLGADAVEVLQGFSSD
eukprot:s6472_g4.t1